MPYRIALLVAITILALCAQASAQESLDWRYRVSADGHYMNGNIKRWYAKHSARSQPWLFVIGKGEVQLKDHTKGRRLPYEFINS